MQKNHHRLSSVVSDKWPDTKGKQQVTNKFGARKRQVGWAIGLLIVACVLTACGAQAAEPADESIAQIRAPYPTFTPTLAPNTGNSTQGMEAQPTPTQPAGQAVTLQTTPPPAEATTPAPTAAATAATPASAPAKAVINTPLVNIRTGPSTDFEIMTVVDRGEEYEIIGKNGGGDWWQVCCVDDVPGWVAVDFVDADGAVESVPLADNSANLVVAATAIPDPSTQTEATQAPVEEEIASPAAAQPVAPTDNFAFDLIVTEQFPESKVVRIFLYAYQGNLALEGFTISVKKDGADVPVSATSFGGPPGFTWPVADVRQRFQNLKVEFPGVTPAGVWTVQLIKDGAPVGPPATFTLGQNEPNQELYVRYEQR